jgi:hypothetical protein
VAIPDALGIGFGNKAEGHGSAPQDPGEFVQEPDLGLAQMLKY